LAALIVIREAEVSEWLRGERGGDMGLGWEEVVKWLGSKVEMEGGWQGSGGSKLFGEMS
jgi:hypothetical protein